jgi:molybdopterin biosynthesis enzyme
MKKILAHKRLQRALNQKGNKPKAVKAKARNNAKAKERVEQITPVWTTTTLATAAAAEATGGKAKSVLCATSQATLTAVCAKMAQHTIRPRK